MSSLFSLIYWLFVLFWTVSCKEIHLSSTGNDIITCGSLQSPCQSLSYILNTSILTNNTSIVINDTIWIDSIVRLTILHNITFSPLNTSTALLQCQIEGEEEEGAGLVFEYCRNINFHRIHITDCSITHNLSSNGALLYRTGTLMSHTTDIYMDHVSITNSMGTGLLLYNSAGSIEISNSIFANNILPYNSSTNTDGNYIHGGSGLVILVSACDVNAESCEETSTVGNYVIHGTEFSNNSVNLTDLSHKQWLFHYGGGLGILLVWNVLGNMFNIESSNFTDNRANCGGGLSWHCEKLCSNNSVEINNCLFTRNSLSTLPFGGAGMGIGMEIYQRSKNNDIIMIDNNISIVNTDFTNNNGYYAAGSLVYSPKRQQDITFFTTHVDFINCTWNGNWGIASPAVEIEPEFQSQQSDEFTIKTTFIDCAFSNNVITKHYLQSSPYTFNEDQGVMIINRLKVYFQGTNTFNSNQGTALYLSTGSAIFKRGSHTIFHNNTGTRGGAIAVISYSNIQYENDTEFVFVKNRANFVGGAIYVLSTTQHSSLSSQSCFLEYSDDQIPFSINNARFKFQDNYAGSDIAHSIFLPSIQPCRLTCSRYSMPVPHPNTTFTNESCLGTFYFSINDSNSIATEGSVFKLLKTPPLEIIPGQKYSLPIQLLDDMNQDVSRTAVYQLTLPSSTDIQISRGFDFIADNTIELLGEPTKTSNLTLTLASFKSVGTSIEVVLSSCPPGYITDRTSCVCSATQNTTLTYNGIAACKEQENVATVIPGYWVGYILENDNDVPSQDNLYTSDCPLGFCHYFNTSGGSNEGPGHRYYSLTNTSTPLALEAIVCTANRKGRMCSQCKYGYSVYFHSSTAKCGPNDLCPWGPVFYILSELLPITILFIVILWFDISLTTGPAYSLIFIIQLLQAMIVSVNGAVHFNPSFVRHTQMILYSMLNLDFFDIDELSYCFWKGANTLDMITMKYLSVVYAIVLVMGFIFLFNNCSCRLRRSASLIGVQRSREHSIIKSPRRKKYSVLHGLTAFLVICYFQCSRVTFLVLNRESPRGIGGKHYKNVVFWDGSLEYFHGKHLLYAIPALVFLIFFVIPFPLVLMLDQFLLQFESFLSRYVSFIRKRQPWTFTHNKIKPLLDSFQGPFKDKYRFFSGLYFAYRIIILGTLVLASTALQYYFLLGMILIAMITIQAMIQPFAKKIDNYIALLVLCNMALINVFTLRIYDLVSDQGYTRTTILLQWLQMILIYSPMVVLIGWCVWAVYKKCVKSSKRSEYSTFDESEFPEEIFSRSVGDINNT